MKPDWTAACAQAMECANLRARLAAIELGRAKGAGQADVRRELLRRAADDLDEAQRAVRAAREAAARMR